MRVRVLVVACLALSAGVASAHPAGHVVASGGGTASGGGFVLHGTVGQAAVGLSGGPANRLCHGFWCFGGSRVVSVDPPGGAGPDLPAEIAFGLPSPSPSRGAVSFALALPAAARVRLTVFDVAGRAIGEPLELKLDAGHHQLRWEPRDGRPGVFFGVLDVDGAVQGRRRIVLVR